MKYPKLTELNTSRDMVDVFRGYNHNLRIGDGEFYDMTNLTSDDYPVLSPRRPRGVYAKPHLASDGGFLGLIAKDSLCYVDVNTLPDPISGFPGESRLYINGNAVESIVNNEGKYIDMTLTTEMAYGKIIPKTLISMGPYIIIMPDKKYYNTANPTDCGEIEAGYSSETNGVDVTFTLCKLDGSDYEVPPENIGPTAPPLPESPEDPESTEGTETSEEYEDGTLWLDTSEDERVLKRYSTANHQWVAVSSTYVKISSTGIGMPFAEGDGVTISGIKDADLQDLNSAMVIRAKSDNYIIVTGFIAKMVTQPYYDDEDKAQPISIKRQMPAMDFIIESGNRLWGCRYGVANNGQVVNEIYASKLGDFKNWNVFAGISTDSYVASVGTDGQFTGAITHLGYPLFFKENYIHKVYGNFPSNYQIQTTACRGVQKDSHKSLAIVNETLFYKSRSAVCAYDGSLPVEMSSALGEVAYSDAVAGVLGNKYYISMKEANADDAKSKYHLFVYDTKKGMWHREDNTHAVEFCSCRGDLYYIDYADKLIKTVHGTGDLHESSIRWSAETGIIGTDSPDKKYISRIDIRMSLKIGTRVFFLVQYDSSGEWEHICTTQGTKLGSFPVPIKPRRCDHLRLRIDGVGEAKIFSISKTIEQGSDI